MKKNIFFLTLLLCAVVNAQVSVGNAEETSYFYGPVNPYYGYSYIQTIYKAADINASGDITALTFEMEDDSTIPNSDDNVDVWIGHTTKEQFDSETDWVDVSSLTQVLTDGTMTKSGTTLTITFETPFTYNGTDNLILAYDANEAQYDASSNKFYTSTNADGHNVSIRYPSDTTNPDPTSPPEADEVASIYADITFMGITQSCPSPNNLSATDITTQSATLTWDEVGSATTWNLEYGPRGFTQGEGTMISGLNTTSYTLEGLDDTTFYEFYVQATCSDDDISSWTTPLVFNTLSEIATPPYSNDFESSMPLGWSTEVLSGNEWEYHNGAPYAHSGSYTMKYGYSSTEQADSWLYTIGFNLQAEKTYKIKFWTKINNSDYSENLKFTVGNDQAVAAQSNVLLDMPNITITDYTERFVEFTPSETGVYYFGFHAYSQANMYNIYIDDFSIEEKTLFSILDTESGYNSGSADWGDYDNDGDVDLIMSGLHDTDGDFSGDTSTTRVYDNDGNGNFTVNESIEILGVHAGDPRWVDYDNDGDLDIAIVGMSFDAGVNQFALYRNDEGTFVSVDSNSEGASFTNVSLGDYDNDGDIDILYSGYTLYATTIMRNTGDGFEKVDLTETIPGSFDGRIVWADIDNDMDLDIVIGGGTQSGSYNLRIYLSEAGVYSAGQVLTTYNYKRPELGDYDNDGDLDIAVKATNENYDDIVEILTNNNGTFEHLVELPGLSTSSGAKPLAWGDYDNDGDLDLAVTGTDPEYEGAVFLYTNDNGTFINTENTGLLPIGTHVATWQDIDGDLSVDLLISGLHTDPNNGEYYGITKIYNNETATVNTAPVAPTELTSTVENGVVTFNWSGSHDAQTGTDGLQYHITVGTTSGGVDIAHYPVHGNQWMLQNLPENTETLYWCVKSMDTAFIMSECSEMQTVSNLGTNDVATTVEGIKLYPNPVISGQDVVLTGDVDVVEVFTTTGQLVKKSTGSTFSTKGLTSGIYFVRITRTSGNIETQKLLVK